MHRPENRTSFMTWSTQATCGVFAPHVANWYLTNQSNLYTTLQDSELQAQMPLLISTARDEYKTACGASLFAFSRTPKLEWNRKSYDSFVDKLFRVNCLENPNFPEPPNGGWCALDTAFERIDDIVRTTIVTAYADGPSFLAGKLTAFANRLGLQARVKDHAQEKGYYAHHVYIRLPLAVSSPTVATHYPESFVWIEIQITTELQGVLREITHRLYERERLEGKLAEDWKAQFQSRRFRAAYMAHSLRFIEAMIIELRGTVHGTENRNDGTKA
jgi:ppGpp synthetase/RelA/SpoT-type nucleotidyltranferase